MNYIKSENEKGKPLVVALEEGSGLIKDPKFLLWRSSAAEGTLQSAAPEAEAFSRRTTTAEPPATAGAQRTATVASFGAVAIATGWQAHRIHRNARRSLLTYSKKLEILTPPPPTTTTTPPQSTDEDSVSIGAESDQLQKVYAADLSWSTMPLSLSNIYI